MPFLDSGKGKVFQFSVDVSVARELTPGPWRHLTIIQLKSKSTLGLNPGAFDFAADADDI